MNHNTEKSTKRSYRRVVGFHICGERIAGKQWYHDYSWVHGDNPHLCGSFEVSYMRPEEIFVTEAELALAFFAKES